jgi:hypothetical protein
MARSWRRAGSGADLTPTLPARRLDAGFGQGADQPHFKPRHEGAHVAPTAREVEQHGFGRSVMGCARPGC